MMQFTITKISGACANSVYQAGFLPSLWPGIEAINILAIIIMFTIILQHRWEDTAVSLTSVCVWKATQAKIAPSL